MKKLALLFAVVASTGSLALLSAQTGTTCGRPGQATTKLELPTDKGRNPLFNYYIIDPVLRHLTCYIVPYIECLQYRWDIPETEADYIKKQSAALEYYDKTGDATATEINALYGYKDKGFGYRHPFKRDLLLYAGIPIGIITGLAIIRSYNSYSAPRIAAKPAN